MANNLYARYIWLVSTLYRNKRMTLCDINNCWLRTDYSGGNPIPRRTFHNHREKIQEFFDINIECDRTTAEYYIEDSDSISKDKIRSWILSSFSVKSLAEEKKDLCDRIILESIPSGEKFLTSIMEAMRENKALNLLYRPFTGKETHNVTLLPYFIRIFRQRWYVIGVNTDYNEIRTYALDRIEQVDILKENFEYPIDFNPEAFSAECFGITNINAECDRIVIKVNNKQASYFKTLPLHSSQKVVSGNADYTVFEYLMKNTFDLRRELMSYGADIEVIEPHSLRAEIASALKDGSALYSNNK